MFSRDLTVLPAQCTPRVHRLTEPSEFRDDSQKIFQIYLSGQMTSFTFIQSGIKALTCWHGVVDPDIQTPDPDHIKARFSWAEVCGLWLLLF